MFFEINFKKTVTKHANTLYIKEISPKRLSPDCHHAITILNDNQKNNGDSP